jgi:hypothetical protein
MMGKKYKNPPVVEDVGTEIINSLSDKYNIKNPQEIKKFLLSNRDLMEILIFGYKHIRRIFGDVPIYLELHRDPEENWDELFIVIRSNYSPRKASELKNKLFDEWFIYIIDKVATRLNFTEEAI